MYPLGATHLGRNTTAFRVWAPDCSDLRLHLIEPENREISMERDGDGDGYFQAVVEGAGPGALYLYRLCPDRERPDPASSCQPRGVHGPSQVTDPEFPWTDRDWTGLPQEQYVLYEIHTGAYTAEGTFDAVIGHLPELRDLGITAIELMPVAAFPGGRNWGYDGVFPYAVQSCYGGPEGLKRLVDACHAAGLALVLDVVYNHLGPEGNYLGDFGPYFNSLYRTPWGAAINFDGPGSLPVREFFVQNALRWVTEFHIDALRLDAVHSIYDQSATHILEEIARRVHARAAALNRRILVFAESDLNNVRMVQPAEGGGYGMDGQWNDDFHHALHVACTGDRNGYYQDYEGSPDVATALAEGFVYSGQYSRHRRRLHGAPSAHIEPRRFIVFSQNHDQVGNRFLGERLSHLTDFESAKLAAAAVILSPYLPMLFMGEEWAEPAPFLYFVSHGDDALIEAVRAGRREEFRHFHYTGEVPDPQNEDTYLRSKLNHALWRQPGRRRAMRRYYRELLSLRRVQPAFRDLSRRSMTVETDAGGKTITMTRRADGGAEIRVLFVFADTPAAAPEFLRAGGWYTLLDSADLRWDGPGSPAAGELNPRSCLVLAAEAAPSRSGAR